MTDLPEDHRPRARRLISAGIANGVDLQPREGQFLGGLSFDPKPLSEKQERWLSILEKRYGGEVAQ